MNYLDGFVIPVAQANKNGFIAYGHGADAVFVRHGALRIFECWPEDVSRGAVTDFFMGVDARDDEVAAFSWIEWQDKATRTASMTELDEVMKADPHFDQAINPLPFDLDRVLWGCFETIVERGVATTSPYVQGFVLAVPEAKKEDCRRLAEQSWESFRECGALRLVAGWEDDVPEGGPTDFFRMVKRQPGEKVVFAFAEWPSRKVCDAAAKRLGEAITTASAHLPFEPARVVRGGFTPVVEAVR